MSSRPKSAAGGGSALDAAAVTAAMCAAATACSEPLARCWLAPLMRSHARGARKAAPGTTRSCAKGRGRVRPCEVCPFVWQGHLNAAPPPGRVMATRAQLRALRAALQPRRDCSAAATLQPLPPPLSAQPPAAAAPAAAGAQAKQRAAPRQLDPVDARIGALTRQLRVDPHLFSGATSAPHAHGERLRKARLTRFIGARSVDAALRAASMLRLWPAVP